VSCPAVEPLPVGWHLWRAPVPPELGQLAVDILHHVKDYPLGSIAKTVVYQNQTVGAWVGTHHWTWRGGQLVTGLCLRGVSLIYQPSTTSTFAEASAVDSLDTPDPTVAAYTTDAGIDWRLVAISGVAGAAVVGLFFFALHHAGKRALRR
jgi:hypothetical protein